MATFQIPRMITNEEGSNSYRAVIHEETIAIVDTPKLESYYARQLDDAPFEG